jgi:YHS domain-containing protein
MKKLVFLLAFVASASYGQKNNYNIQKGAIAKGYDVVSYFDNTAVKGDKKFSVEYDHVTFLFSSQENVNIFKKNPQKFIPQYGGYCAYAIGVKGSKVSINPEAFEIRDGKLYLFYHRGRTNTLNLWLQEGPEKLKKQADKNWKKITE